MIGLMATAGCLTGPDSKLILSAALLFPTSPWDRSLLLSPGASQYYPPTANSGEVTPPQSAASELPQLQSEQEPPILTLMLPTTTPSSRESPLLSVVLSPVSHVAGPWILPTCIMETVPSLVSLLMPILESPITGSLDQPGSKRSSDLGKPLPFPELSCLAF